MIHTSATLPISTVLEFREIRSTKIVGNGDLLTLARTKRRIKTGGKHFGFEMRTSAEVDKCVKWLKKNHVTLTSKRQEESGRGVYFRDPDGYLIEIFYEKS